MIHKEVSKNINIHTYSPSPRLLATAQLCTHTTQLLWGPRPHNLSLFKPVLKYEPQSPEHARSRPPQGLHCVSECFVCLFVCLDKTQSPILCSLCLEGSNNPWEWLHTESGTDHVCDTQTAAQTMYLSIDG